MTNPSSEPVAFDEAIRKAACVLDAAQGCEDAALIHAKAGLANAWLSLAGLVLQDRQVKS